MRLPAKPGWSHERHRAAAGFRCVAGVDEVGRGSLAGPVVAAAVILEPGCRLRGVNDSKLLTAARREELLRQILRSARAWGFGAAGAFEIDQINILNATRLAMRRAVEALDVQPDHLLIDAVDLADVPVAQTAIVKGDRISVSIAAASIVAKVVRDRVMDYFDRVYPGFGFASHKGYGTSEHIRVVAERGPCPIHRLTFRGVRIESGRHDGELLGH